MINRGRMFGIIASAALCAAGTVAMAEAQTLERAPPPPPPPSPPEEVSPEGLLALERAQQRRAKRGRKLAAMRDGTKHPHSDADT